MYGSQPEYGGLYLSPQSHDTRCFIWLAYLANSSRRNGTRKLDWFLKQNDLFEVFTRHELGTAVAWSHESMMIDARATICALSCYDFEFGLLSNANVNWFICRLCCCRCWTALKVQLDKRQRSGAQLRACCNLDEPTTKQERTVSWDPHLPWKEMR